jgi:catecholate siderophore receptor
MSSVRIPGSLRKTYGATDAATRSTAHTGSETGPQRKDGAKAGLLTAACLMAAASPVSLAWAQGAPGGNLPPVNVEAKNTKKKAPAPAQKKAGGAPVAAPAPAPATPPPGEKSANPYANPDAPYKVERSGSGKITEPLVNTPRTVTAIPKEVITDTAATSLRDIARQTPGVTLGFAEGGNAFGDRIYIRGFDARGDIFVDGIRDPGNASREVFAVEQIEVLKGPAATIGGRGVTGGALNIITKKPYDDRDFFNVSTMLGTDHTIRGTVDVNQRLGPGVTVRANLLYHEAEVAGRDQVEDQRWGGFISVALKPSDTFKVTIDYYRYRTDGIPDFGVPLNTTFKLPWPEFGVSRSNWYGNAARDFMKNSQDVITTTVEAKLSSNVALTSKSRMGTTVVDYIASAPNGAANNATTVTIGNPQRYQEADLLANQTDLTFKFATFGMQHTLVTGVEVSREEIGRYSYAGLVSAPQSLRSPNPYPVWNGIIPPRTWVFDATIDTVAFYLLDTIKLSEQWYINGGIRFDRFDRSSVGPPNANPNNNPNTSRVDDLFNWNIGVVYKPIPIASIYAAYATSSNPVGQELDATGVDYGGLAVSLSALSPEKNTAVEVGTKWELFNKRLLATAALFQTEKENAREASPLGGTNPPTSTGAYRVRGFELGAQGNVTEKWSVYGGLVVMETEVLESATPAFVGRRLANVPLKQFSLLSKYQLNEQLSVGGQATYSSEVFSGVLAADNNFFRIPEHWRFDALSEYKFTKNFSAQFNVVNLTNEVYYDALYRSNNPFVFIAPGRAAYLTLNWKY